MQKILHDSPRIILHENRIAPVHCQYIMDFARSRVQSAQTYGHTGERISDMMWIAHKYDSEIYQIIRRFAWRVKQKLHYAEPLQVASYGPGGKFDAHMDCYQTHTEHGAIQVAHRGQRLVTAILYLNTVVAGGETTFPSLGITVQPKQGDVLMFENCYPGTNEPHPLSLHEGCPVQEGEKWIATLWFREKPQR